MKNLKYAYLIILVTISLTSVYSQSIKQYSGEYSNGTVTPGKATYSYFEKDGVMIKHGKFSYSCNVKSTLGFYNCTISGNYFENNKDGDWIYSINYQDYNTGYGNIYSSGNIKLTSNYNKGFPNGNWNYSETNKARSKTFTGWSEYNPTTTVSLSANFKDGNFVGSFNMKGVIENTFDNISGEMDNNGFCNNEWILSKGKSNIEIFKTKFYKSVQISHSTIEQSTGQVLDKSDFTDSEINIIKKFADNLITYDELKNNGIKIDTNKCATNGFLYLNSTFYNSNFLQAYITGDKCFDNVTNKFTGGGFYMITTERLKLKKLTEIINRNGADYNEAVNILKNTTSSSNDLKRALDGLLAIKECCSNVLSKEDIQLLNIKIDECKYRLESEIRKEKEKQNEYKLLTEFEPANKSIDTLVIYLDKAKKYNTQYPAKKSQIYMPSDIEKKISSIEDAIKLKKEEQRKQEFYEILLFDPKKKSKQELTIMMEKIKIFKTKYELTEGDKFDLERIVPVIEKALKKCKD